MRRWIVCIALVLACTPHREEPRAVEASPVVAPPEPLTIEVHAEWPGADVLAVERSLVVPLERALQGVPELTRIHSVARVDRATLVLTLDARADPGLSRATVHERLAAARTSLPDDVVPVIGADLAPPAEALVFALTASTDSMQLHRSAEALREALAVLPGVGAVETCGGREPALIVAVDPERLRATGVSVAAVVSALMRDLGDDHQTRSIADLQALRISGAVTLRDLASVAVTARGRDCDGARVAGGPAVLGQVRAHRGADPQVLAAQVRARLAAWRSEAPVGFELVVPAAAPLRLALEWTASTRPSEALTAMSRAVAGALTAAGPALADRAAFVRMETPPRGGSAVDAELWFDSSGLDATQLAALEQALAATPELRVRGPGAASVTGELADPAVLRLRISGEELEVDRRLAREAVEIATSVPGVLRAGVLRDDLWPGLVVVPRRERLAALGLATDELIVTVAAAIDGAEAGLARVDGIRMPVLVRIGEGMGDDPADVSRFAELEIAVAGGTARLADLCDIRSESGPGVIARIDGRRVITVELRVREPGPALRGDVERALAEALRLPPGHTVALD